MSLFSAIHKDYRRYRAEGAPSWAAVVLYNHGFWATCYYRISRHVQTKIRPKLLGKIIGVPIALLRPIVESVTGTGLGSNTEVGEGLCIFHFGPTTISGATRIGNNVNLRHGVTIGGAGRGDKKGSPVIGNRVDIGAHAIVIGNITIGDDAVVGAGAVVTKSVPPRRVVVGNPAKQISAKGSFDFVFYDGMETDPERQASLDQRDIELQNPES